MADHYSSSRIDDLPSLWDGMCKLVRSGLGLTAFGVNVLDIGLGFLTTDHTESESGQEGALTSSCEARPPCSSGRRVRRSASRPAPGEVEARVAPEARRLFQTGSQGARLLIVGASAR